MKNGLHNVIKEEQSMNGIKQNNNRPINNI